jgi:hypothetical protein
VRGSRTVRLQVIIVLAALSAAGAQEVSIRESLSLQSAEVQSVSTTVALKALRFECRLRHRLRSSGHTGAIYSHERRGIGKFMMPGNFRLYLGHLRLRWSVGCLIPSQELKALTASAAPLLRRKVSSPVRGSTSWSGWSSEGAALEKCGQHTGAGLWHRIRDRGGWFSHDGWGLLVAHIGPLTAMSSERISRGTQMEGQGWSWSGRYEWSDPMALTSSPRFALEVSGPLRPPGGVGNYVAACGGAWRTGTSAALGAMSGWFRFRDPLTWSDSPDGQIHELDSGWSLLWSPPGVRGSSIRLIQRRQDRPGSPLPVLERRLRLQLAAEPWSGCQFNLNLAGRVRRHCRAFPTGETGKVVVESHQSRIDLRLRLQLDHELSWTIRHCHTGGDTQLDVASIPTEPAILKDTATTDGGLAWWAKDSGAVTWMQLKFTRRSWYGGLMLAATPVSGADYAAIPVRLPPAAGYWRTVGSNTRCLECWWGRKLRRWRLEGAVRYQIDVTGGDPSLTIQIGIERRFRSKSHLRETADGATMPVTEDPCARTCQRRNTGAA